MTVENKSRFGCRLDEKTIEGPTPCTPGQRLRLGYLRRGEPATFLLWSDSPLRPSATLVERVASDDTVLPTDDETEGGADS